ncbi:MAG: MFS transporter [Actinomycetes bacterium]
MLRSPALRRVLVAFLVFNTTEWATWIAILVWAFDTGGAGAAGLIAVVQLVPATLVAPFAAVLGDRVRRDRALSIGYALQATAMLGVGVTLVTHAPTIVVYVTAAVAATSIVLTRPVHNAIIPEIAETPAQITAGNSASSTVEGAAAFVGPLLTGVLLAQWGPGSVFLTMGVLTVGSAVITRHLPLQRTFDRHGEHEGAVQATLGGLRELRRDAGALLLTIMVGAQFVVVGILDILNVVLGIDILDLGSSGPGLLTSALGIGGLLGAAATILLIGRRRLAPAIAVGLLVTGLPIALVSLATLPAVAWLLLAASGLGKAFADVAGRTLLQRTVRADVLSRIFGVQESLIMGGTALGSAVAPVLVHVFGPRGAFLATGVFLPAVGLLAWTRIRRLDAQALQPGPGFSLLEAIPVFAMLPQATLEQLSRELVPATARAGTDLVVQGEDGDRLYLVATGSVSIIKNGVHVATTRAGGYFGEISLLRDVPRTATVRADEDITLYTLGRVAFLEAVTGQSSARDLADEVADRRIRDE